jgi:hypothetical protein
MAMVFRSIARLYTAMTILFGVRPRVVSLLDTLQRPSVRMVVVTQRQRVEYASLFTTDTVPAACDEALTCQESTQAGLGSSQPPPIHRPARRRYIPVHSA